MKTCPKCEAQNSDESLFCQNCGFGFIQSSSAPEDTEAKPVHTEIYQRPAFDGGATAKLKAIGTSPLYLAAVSLLTLAVLSSVVYCFIGGDIGRYSDMLKTELSGNGGGFAYENLLDEAVIGLAPLVQAPVMLICAGLWMFFAACRKPEPSASGLGLVRIILIAFLCFLVLFACAGIISFIHGTIAMGSGASALLGSGPLAFLFLGLPMAVLTFYLVLITSLIALVAALAIIYCVKAIKTVKAVSHTAKTGIPDANVSMYFIVMNFIMGVFIVGSGFPGLESRLWWSMWPALVSGCGGGAFLVMISIILLRYKKAMQSETTLGGI